MAFNYTKIDKEFLRVLGTIDHVTHLRLFSNEFWPCTNLGQDEMRMTFLLASFLDGTTQLFKRSCPSVRPSVRPKLFLSSKIEVFNCEKTSILQNNNGDITYLCVKSFMALLLSFHPSFPLPAFLLSSSLGFPPSFTKDRRPPTE